MRYLLIILSILFLLNCSKDPLKVESKTLAVKDTLVILDNLYFDVNKRNGGVDRIFFRGKYTSDNYLEALTSSGTIPREYEAFNKDKIAYFYFSPGVLPNTYSDVPYQHYTIKTVKKDSTFVIDTYYSKDTIDYFKLIPINDGILTNNHSAFKVTWTEAGKPFPNFNEYRNSNNLLNQWIIRFDNMVVTIKNKEPINKNSTKFQLPNIH